MERKKENGEESVRNTFSLTSHLETIAFLFFARISNHFQSHWAADLLVWIQPLGEVHFEEGIVEHVSVQFAQS